MRPVKFAAVSVAIAFAWMAVWALALRAFGIPMLMRSPEERAARKQWILKIGKLRYVFLFGVLGSGMGFGLGFGVAAMMSDHSFGWDGAAIIVGAVSLFIGCFNGVRAWNQLFHTEVPFPPVYPPRK